MNKYSFLKTLLSFILLTTMLVSSPLTLVNAADEDEPLEVSVSVNPEQVVVGQTVKVQFDLFVDMSEITCQTDVIRPLDVVLVVDTSGSMNESVGTTYDGTKLEGAVEAVQTFLSQMSDENDLAGLVGFSGEATRYFELSTPTTVIGGLADFYEAESAGGASTYIASGIVEATDILRQSGRGDTAHAIILLTDGYTDARQEAIDQAALAKAEDIRFITIGLGADVDEALLRTIASSTDDYYFVPETSELASAYETISNSLEIIDAVTNITVRYQFDRDIFDLVEDSVYPEATVNYDQITWELPFMDDGNRQALRVELEPKSQGNSYAATNFQVDYQLCDQPEVFSTIRENFLPVEVGPGDKLYCPESDGTLEVVPFSLCRIPWGLIAGLIAFLLLLLFWFLKHRDVLAFWDRVAKKIKRCVIWDLPWRLFLALFLGFLLHSIVNNLCSPTTGAIFLREFPDRSTAMFMKAFDPEGKTEQITQRYSEEEKLSFFTASEINQAIYAVSYDKETPRLVGFDLDEKAVGFTEVQGFYPVLSPDQTKIAYVSQDADIMILNVASGAIEPLEGASDPLIIESMPAWHPDGETIAFVRAGTSGQAVTITVPCDIMTVSAEGGTPIFLTGASGIGFNYSPVYSPDGEWLAFFHHETGTTTYNDPRAVIQLIPSQGGESTSIAPAANTKYNGGNTWITWEPESTALMYSSMSCDGQYDIVRVSIDDAGKPVDRERVGFASSPDSYEFGLQYIQLEKTDLMTAILRTLPWLGIALLLWFIKAFIFCRKPKPENLEDTITVEVVVDKERGLLLPDERFQVTSILTGKPLCPPVVKDRKADVVMLLDTSASMDGLPLVSAVNAAKKFIEEIISSRNSTLRRFAVLGFDNHMNEYQTLTSERKALLSALDKVKTGGSTNMAEGLERAIEILKTEGRSDSRRVILLLTDGYPDDAEAALRLSRYAQEENIRIFAIGVGEANKELLREIAGDDGTHTYIKSAVNQKELVKAFKRAAQDTLLLSPAKDVSFEHRYNPENFEIISGSILPGPQMVDEENGIILWHTPEVNEKGKSFSYTVRPLIADMDNDQYIDQHGHIEYYRCETLKKKMVVDPGAVVRVSGYNTANPKPQLAPLAIKDPDIIWQPDQAVFIGVGGVGRLTLTYIKKNLLDAGAGKLGDGIEFLVLDTDIYEKLGDKKAGFSIARTSMDNDDIFVLDENLQPLVENNLGSSFNNWFNFNEFNGDPNLNLASGTMGNRLKPRLALIRNLMREPALENTSRWFGRMRQENRTPFFEEWLQKRCENAHRIDPNGVNKLRVYIVGSLAGGMSGTIIDVAYLARKIGRQLVKEDGELQIEGHFLDGNSFTGIVPNATVLNRCKANAAASQREINRWQLNTGYPYTVEWDEQGQGLREPLFEVVTRYSRQSATEGVSGLTKEIIPEMADVVTTRLDKAMRDEGAADWFDGLKAQSEMRRQDEHAATVGLPRCYSWRLPIADILKNVHVGWISTFFKQALNPRLALDAFEECDPQLIFNDKQLSDESIQELGVRPYIYNFLLGGGRTAFAGEASKESRYLGNQLLAEEDRLEIKHDDLSFDQASLEEFHKRLKNALAFFMIGSENSADGQIGSRLATLRTFVISLQGTLRSLSDTENFDGSITEIAKAYLEILNNLQLVQEINNLQEALYVKPDNQNQVTHDALHWMNQKEKQLENTKEDLDEIESRKYLWDHIQEDAAGNRTSTPFEKLWREKYLEENFDDFVSYLQLDINEDGHLDLMVNIDPAVYLLQDGKEEFMGGLMRIAGMQTRDAWRETTLNEVMEKENILKAPAQLAKNWVTFNSWLVPGTGNAVTKKLYGIGSSEVNAAITPSAFGQDLLNTVNLGDTMYFETSFLQSTDRLSFALLHDVEAVSMQELAAFHEELEQLKVEDGLNRESKEFSGVLHQRFVFDGEAQMQAFERSNLLKQIQAAYTFHPHLAGAFSNLDSAEKFALAYAMGFILEHPQTHTMHLVISKMNGEREIYDFGVVSRPGVSKYIDTLYFWISNSDHQGIQSFKMFLNSLSRKDIQAALQEKFGGVRAQLQQEPGQDVQSFKVFVEFIVRRYLVEGV